MDDNPTSSPSRIAQSKTIFEGVSFHIASSFHPERISELEAALLAHGARQAKGLDDEALNIVVADGPRWEGWHIIRDMELDEQSQASIETSDSRKRRKVEVVTDNWVERSIVLNRLQSAHFFSPDPAQLFSTIVACATALPSSDLETLSGGITALGGQWRMGLTKDVTHLFAISPGSSKYETAMHYQKTNDVKVLLPHWFDDVMRLGIRTLPTVDYEWPEPRVLNKTDSAGVPLKEGTDAERANAVLKRSMFVTAALLAPAMNASSPQAPPDLSLIIRGCLSGSDVYTLPRMWNGRRVLLSRTLQLFGGRRTSVEASIERAGGVVVKFPGDEDEEEPEEEYEVEAEDGGNMKKMTRLARNERQRRRAEAQAVAECDILVTRWRYGRAYVEAVRTHKTIGTLAWLYHVQATGVLVRPVNQLLHYPVPKRIIEGFSNHVITVTNYTGEAREYLKKLINVMGATFTASMSNQNTVLIAANTTGTKAVKAQAWSIAVVNHTWLEDCFIQWRNLTPALERYIVFPTGIDFSSMLGERGVWVGIGGDVMSNASQTLQEDVQKGHHMRDRLEIEAEDLADEDEILSDLEREGDEVDQENVAALLAPPAPSAKVEEVDLGIGQGLGEVGENVFEHGGMDIDVDPRADDWDIPEFDDEPVRDVQDTPQQRAGLTPKKAGKESSRKETASNAKEETRTNKPTRVEDEQAEEQEASEAAHPGKPTDVLELEDSSDEEERTRQPAKGKGKEKSTYVKVVPQVKAKATPSSKTKSNSKGSKVREESEVTSPSAGNNLEEIRVAPRPKPRPRGAAARAPTPEPFEVQGEEDEDEDSLPSRIVPRSHTKSKVSDPPKGKGRIRLPTSSTEDSETDVDNPPASTKKLRAQDPAKKAKGKDPTPDEEEDSDSAIIVPQRKAKSAVAGLTTPITPALSAKEGVGATVATGSTSRLGLLNRPKVDARTKVRKKKVVEEVESEEEEEEEVVAVKGKGKGKGKSESNEKTKGGKGAQVVKTAKTAKKGNKVLVYSSEDEGPREAEEEEEEEVVKPSRSKGKHTVKNAAAPTKGKAKAVARDTHATRKKPLKVYSASSSVESEDEEDEEVPSPSSHLLSKSAVRKSNVGKAKEDASEAAKAKPGPSSKTERANVKSSTVTAKAKSTKKAESPETESASEEEEEDTTRTKPRGQTSSSKPQLAVTPKATPKRVMSVLMPSLKLSPTKVKPKKGDRRGKGPISSAEEDDEDIVVSKGRGKPAAVVRELEKKALKSNAKPSSKPKPKSKRPPSPIESEENTEDEEEVSILVSPRTRAVARTDSIRAAAGQVVTAGPSNATQGRAISAAKPTNKVAKKPVPMDVDEPVAGPSSLPRRSAATKATQKLRDTIMPDLVSFEQQMRKASKARRSSGRGGMESFVVEGAEEDDGYTLSAGGARKRNGTQDGEEEDTGRKKKRRISDTGDAIEVKHESKRPGAGKEKSTPMDVDEDVSPTVRIMTTQVMLGDDIIKGLKKLGAVVTTRPNECTHLLARQVVRTEKFLCALASAQWILSEKWAVACVDAQRLLPEKQFVLKDKEGENKYGVELLDALRRAKEYHGKMLEGHTFYVTPRVPVDTKLLKSVVNACGGVLSTQTPTVRIINAAPDTRHVISCKEDVSIWRPLAQQGIKVYNQELLLTGILRQDIEWDEEDFMVQV